MRNKKVAFSLIELSIVILLIALIVGAIVSSNAIVTKSHLTNARAVTSSSPVTSTPGLALWLEATSEKSFIATEAVEGTALSIWYDINDTDTKKNNATQNNATNKPRYTKEAINGLPAVKFPVNGLAAMALPDDIITGDYTVFIVDKLLAPNISLGVGAYSFMLGSSVGTAGSPKLTIGYINNTNITGTGPVYLAVQHLESGVPNYYYGSTTSFSANNSPPNINVVACSGANGRIIHSNGVNQALTAGTPSNGNTGGTSLPNRCLTGFKSEFIGEASLGGGSFNYFGYIGEIIIFSRSLNALEIRAIEDYLSKKWRVRIS